MKINYDPRELKTAIAYIDDYCRDQDVPCEKCVFWDTPESKCLFRKDLTPSEWVSEFSLR